MASNPIMLGLRFLIELAALAAYGYWGWTQNDGILRWILTLSLIIIPAAIWGIFRVPDDPKEAPVAISGPVRFVIEFIFFTAAIGLLAAADQSRTAIIVGIIVVLHYIGSYDRIQWRFSQQFLRTFSIR